MSVASALILIAGLMGAAGVFLSAASAHALPNANLDTAGTMLLIHAAAVIGGVATAAHGLAHRPVALAACGILTAGALLFAGDLALRAYMGVRLFPGAAPAGGVLLIAGWIGVALSALLVSFR